MTSGREIVTLQFGTYANFVGTHLWNIQESSFDYHSTTPSEINHSVLYREGLTNQGHVTFTPRLLLADLKGSLNCMSKEGDLYGKPPLPTHNQALWPKEKIEIIQDSEATKNKFLENLDAENIGGNDETLPDYEDLDNCVEVWSDFLYARYHPNTVNIVNEYQYGSTAKPFDIFNYGTHIWKTPQFEDDYTDRLRKFVEECDSMQGFHVLLDGTDGFAGLGSSALQYLEDEYANKSVLVFPIIQSYYPFSTPVMDCVRTINLSLLFPKLTEHSSLFVPLSVSSHGWRQPGPPRQFPHLKFNNTLPYHTSAILGTAIDTISLNYRLKDNSGSLSEMCENLNKLGRKAAAASVNLPFPLMDDAYLLDTLEQWEGPLWQSLSPTCSLNDDRIWIQYVILRGILQERLKNPNRIYQERNPAYMCSNIQEMLSLFLSCCSYATSSQVTTANTPCKVTKPFPEIFSDYVSQKGSLGANVRTGSVTSVPVIAGMHSSRSVGNMIENLHSEVAKLNIRRFHHFASSGLESDEYSTNMEHVLVLAECYHEEFNV